MPKARNSFFCISISKTEPAHYRCMCTCFFILSLVKAIYVPNAMMGSGTQLWIKLARSEFPGGSAGEGSGVVTAMPWFPAVGGVSISGLGNSSSYRHSQEKNMQGQWAYTKWERRDEKLVNKQIIKYFGTSYEGKKWWWDEEYRKVCCMR